MVGAYRDIARVLDGARRRQGWIVLATAAGWGATAALASLLAGAAWLARRPDAALARAASVSLAAAALAAAVLWAGLALRRRASSAEAVARTVGDAEPSLRSDLVSAVELERDPRALAGHYSPALVEEHAARTAARAAAVDLRRALPSRPSKHAWSALGVTALANLLALAAGGNALLAGYAALAGARGDGAAPRIAPITGDVELTYRYPAYMAREPATVAGSGGEIHAPLGTEVTLETRADRDVEAAELVLSGDAVRAGPGAAPGAAKAGATAPRPAERAVSLAVTPPRDLAGRLLVEGPGTYRFRFTRRGKTVAEGPPVAIVVEPDLAPEVRLVRPQRELEVQPGAKVPLEWTASDDWGLSALSLVVKREGRGEERTKLADLPGLRREGGTATLDTAVLRLAEGERVQYWLEALDGDAVSGPKRGASATHVLKIYSADEHRRLALEKAKELWEAMIANLGERLELLEPGRRGWTPARVTQAQAVDGRTRALHERLAAGAAELGRDRAAPRELARALSNVAAKLAPAERDVSQLREALARTLAFQREDGPLLRRVEELDERLDAELEGSVLYLEQLLDQQRADDLVRLAKELRSRRRELAALAEQVRDAPTEEGKRALLAEARELKRRLDELSRRMAELAKGLEDEHMNAEALAEMERAGDARQELDDLERALERGDLDQALAALDALGARMDELVAGMERAARRPGEQNAALARELRELREEVARLEASQRDLAAETEQEKAAFQRELARRLRDAEAELAALRKLTAEARAQVERTRPGLTPRAEHDHEHARDRLQDLERALAARDLDASLEAARRALPPTERLASSLDEDLQMVERFPQMGASRDLPALRGARDAASLAVPPARQVRERLERLFPDPRGVLPPASQARLERQGRRQQELAGEAQGIRERIAELSRRAPVFPPQAQGAIGEAQEQMEGAAGELGQRNPQRGSARQRQAMDALGRFRQGMEQMARRGGGQGEEGMPMPFAMESGGREEGDGRDPSPEDVEIPGAEAHRSPEAFRRDLMEAMRQGSPERYRGEVSRYYQEIVK